MIALLEKMSWLRTVKARLSNSPIAYRLARGAFWSLVGGIASRAMTMGSSIIVARLLGREGYGEMGMIQSTMGVFGVFAGFGLGATATKYIAEFRTKDPSRAGRIANLTIVVALCTTGLMAIVCLGMSGWLAKETLSRAELAPLLVAGSLLLFVSTIGGVLSATLSGFEAFREIAKINIWQGVATPIITIPLVWFYGVQGAIASMTINAGIGLFLCVIALQREYTKFDISMQYDQQAWSDWPVLWHFALPSMISGLLLIPVTWVTQLILVRQPGGYGELGLFSAANQWRMIIVFLPGLLASAILPVLSDTHGRSDHEGFRQTIVLNLRATWVTALPLTIGVITLGRPIAAIYGRQFIGTEVIIPTLMIATFLFIVNSTVGAALAGAGHMWTGTLMNLGWAIALIILALVLVPAYGGYGLALAYMIAYLFHTIWQMAYVEIKLSSKSIMSQWRLIIFTAGLMVVSIYLTITPQNFNAISVLILIVSFFPLINLMKESYAMLKCST